MKRGIGFLLEGYMFNNKDKAVEYDIDKTSRYYKTICKCRYKHEETIKSQIKIIEVVLERYSVMIDNKKHIGYIGICDECGRIHYSLKEE